MDLKKTNAFLTILLCFLFAGNISLAGIQENDLVKAIQLFDKEMFSEAEQSFKKLVDENPDHLMVNYYYGACRTENGHYGSREIIYLLNGSIGEAPLKTDYYLGVQYHAQKRWGDAIKHYNRYQGKASVEDQKAVQLSEKIQMCFNKQNPFVNEESQDILLVAVPRENEIEEYDPVISEELMAEGSEEGISSNDSESITPAEKLSAAAKPEPEKTPINFYINSEISYLDTSHFRTDQGLKQYNKGIEKQNELDEKVTEIDKLRKRYGTSSSYNEKQDIGEQILAGETDVYTLQDETNSLLLKAQQTEIDYWEDASQEEKETFISELKALSDSEQDTPDTQLNTDTTTLIDPMVLLGGTEPVKTNESDAEDELIYKIQLGAYSRGLPAYVKRLFDKLSYIRKIENYTDEKGVVVYTTGNLNNYEDALLMQNQVRQEGVEDAYVVPYFNEKRITLKEAKEIEAGK